MPQLDKKSVLHLNSLDICYMVTNWKINTTNKMNEQICPTKPAPLYMHYKQQTFQCIVPLSTLTQTALYMVHHPNSD